MISYVTLGSSDLARSRSFYDAALAPLSLACHYAGEDLLGYGPAPKKNALFICHPFDGAAPTAGNGTMIALEASTRAMVDAVHAAALAQGGKDEGAPGVREAYGPDFYVGYFRDPDGNKLAVVCQTAGTGA